MEHLVSIDARQACLHCPSTGAVVGITQCGKTTWITRWLQHWPKLVRNDDDGGGGGARGNFLDGGGVDTGDAAAAAPAADDAAWPVKVVYCMGTRDDALERRVR